MARGKAMSITCPVCGAAPGEGCVYKSGRPKSKSHKSRNKVSNTQWLNAPRKKREKDDKPYWA